jgi:KaiC/GvpD/RAD55 family RecA-like ATPase
MQIVYSHFSLTKPGTAYSENFLATKYLQKTRQTYLTTHNFKLISTNRCELLEWVDLFIHMTGASHRLRQLLDRFGPDLCLFRDQILPKVKKLRELESKWTQLGQTFTPEQRKHMKQYGYVPMTDHQIKMAYEGKEAVDKRNAEEFLRQLKGGGFGFSL